MPETLTDDGRWRLMDTIRTPDGRFLTVSTVDVTDLMTYPWFRLLDSITGLPAMTKDMPFETLVFDDNGPEELDMMRYATQEEARSGHTATIMKWVGGDYSHRGHK